MIVSVTNALTWHCKIAEKNIKVFQGWFEDLFANELYSFVIGTHGQSDNYKVDNLKLFGELKFLEILR